MQENDKSSEPLKTQGSTTDDSKTDPLGDPNPDACLESIGLPENPTSPARQPIHLSTVYICESTEMSDQVLGGAVAGFAYRRDGHPNDYLLAERCRRLHQADFAAITPSGMAAMSLALLALCKTGDHVLISNQLYGLTEKLFREEATRMGIETTVFQVDQPGALADRVTDQTRLVIAETISNPLMNVANIHKLSQCIHQSNPDALLLIDNTFASPIVCQPLRQGADLVMESMTKIINGHSDVLMGCLAGRQELAARVEHTQKTWGLTAAAFDCWLADRGISSMRLRVKQACQSAATLVRFLHQQPTVRQVFYPQSPASENTLSRPPKIVPKTTTDSSKWLQFNRADDSPLLGYMLAFELPSRQAVDRFIQKSKIHLCPSLGDVATTLSHPLTASHRGLPADQLQAAGINDGILRVSVGIEPIEELLGKFTRGLSALDDLVLADKI